MCINNIDNDNDTRSIIDSTHCVIRQVAVAGVVPRRNVGLVNLAWVERHHIINIKLVYVGLSRLILVKRILDINSLPRIRLILSMPQKVLMCSECILLHGCLTFPLHRAQQLGRQWFTVCDKCNTFMFLSHICVSPSIMDLPDPILPMKFLSQQVVICYKNSLT